MSALVVALNPSVDVEWTVARVRWEEKNSIRTERRWPGGKGVNVARWLGFLGAKRKLLLPLGGATGREMATGLRAEKIPFQKMALREATRANVIVTSEGQGQLRFNPAGPELSPREWQGVKAEIKKALPKIQALVLSGSLPRGVTAGAYAEILRLASVRDGKTFLDCDGEALRQGVKQKPFLVKPNEDELAQWAGKKLKTKAQVLAAARQMAKGTGGWVLVSRGGEGALLVGAKEAWQAPAIPVKVRNTVGAGDALLAGTVASVLRGEAPPEWLLSGLEAAAYAVQGEAGQMPTGCQAVLNSTVSRIQ